MKVFIFVAVIIALVSCKSYHMIEGKSFPVYFTADTSVFNDPAFPNQYISYHDLYNLAGANVNVLELNKDKRAMAVIDRPTFFSIGFDNFLVYPREHILVKKGNGNYYTFLRTKRNSRRNRELSVLIALSTVEVYSTFDRPKGLPLSEILLLEQRARQDLSLIASINSKKFDSLCIAYRVSKKFRKIAGDELRDKHYLSLYFFYLDYKDTLKAYGLYQSKCREIVASINQIPEAKRLTYSVTALNEIADAILPYKINNISTTSEYAACFDSIEQIFRGPSRDYLLSRLMYHSIVKRVRTDSAYMLKYEKLTFDNSMKRAIYDVKKQEEAYDSNTVKDSEMALVGVDGKNITGIESILADNKGKIVILDFGATWCHPCREAAPKLDQLVKQYPSNKIAVIKISFDSETQNWQKFVLANDKENASNNFLLINGKPSALVEKYDITAIPRYLVYNAEGTLINDKAPVPPAQGLKEIIDSNLK